MKKVGRRALKKWGPSCPLEAEPGCKLLDDAAVSEDQKLNSVLHPCFKHQVLMAVTHKQDEQGDILYFSPTNLINYYCEDSAPYLSSPAPSLATNTSY